MGEDSGGARQQGVIEVRPVLALPESVSKRESRRRFSLQVHLKISLDDVTLEICWSTVTEDGPISS